jgi:HNH endonuclease
MPDFGTIDHTSPPVKFAPIGCCIYCGSTEPPLTDEHIIPQGLGGREFLRDASCESCRVKTGKFEEVVQRGMVWALRRTLGMRGKRRPPSHIPAAGWRDGKPYAEVTMHDKIAVKGALPVFSRPPGLLVGQTYLDDAPLQTGSMTPARSGISERLVQLLTLIQWLQFECLQKLPTQLLLGYAVLMVLTHSSLT